MISNSRIKINQVLILLAGILLALWVRIQFFSIISADVHGYVIPWYDYFDSHGFILSLSDNFYNYNPPYLYLIGITTFFPWVPKLIAIKLISVGFDFIAALAALFIVRLQRQEHEWSWLAFFFILFLPTVFVESGIWGQCDIIYCAFLLWMIYFLLKESYLQALVFFSIAFVFKFQAIILAPLILLLIIQRKMRLSWLFFPLGIYLLSIIPVWLAGRPLIDILSIYLTQASTYSSLSSNAPNLFLLFSSEEHYHIVGIVVGLVVTAVFVTAYIITRLIHPPKKEPKIYLFDAVLLAFIIPFLLPKMHERYFFMAGLCFILITFFDKRAFIPAVLLQVSSLLSYINYLYIIPINLSLFAMVINIGLVVWTLLWYWQIVHNPNLSKVPNTINKSYTSSQKSLK